MKRTSGEFKKILSGGESYNTFIPSPLPPNPEINFQQLQPKLLKANKALNLLNGSNSKIPNKSLFIYMYLRKEALLSSQIEGTQSSFYDLILFDNDHKSNVSLEDVEEVSNYVKALQHGLKRLQEDFPMSLRLLREIHEILLAGTRGKTKLPGEFRRTQNWIGGTRPGVAAFVPPPPNEMDPCLSDLEKFFYNNSLPPLIKAGLIHVQFETIHPFLDGNGRLGRLLVTLLLCWEGEISDPILYLSLYLKQNRDLYYKLLQDVRETGDWERWLEFFLEGVYECAFHAINTAEKLNCLFEKDMQKIQSLGRIRISCEKVFDYLKRLPQVSVPLITEQLKLSAPTARNALQQLEKSGIVFEISGKKRDKVYQYQNYLNILEEGAKPFGK